MTNFYLTADRIDYHEMSYLKRMKKVLESKGNSVTIKGVGPSTIQNAGLSSSSKGKVGIFLVGGSDAGMYQDFVQGVGRYYHYDYMWVAFAGWIGNSWITEKGLKTKKLVRAWDDNYSGSYIEGVGMTAEQYFNKHSNKIKMAYGNSPEALADMIASGKSGEKGSDETLTSETNKTIGFDKENPFKGYIAINYEKVKKGSKPHTKRNNGVDIYLDFSQDSNVQYWGYEGITPVWVNNSFKRGEVNLLDICTKFEEDLDKKYDYYLTFIGFENHTGKDSDLYDAKDSDSSSYKMLLKWIGLRSGKVMGDKSYDTGGKTILEDMQTFVKESGYDVRFNYADTRYKDTLTIFTPSKSPVFTIREDDDRFLNLSDIEYNNNDYITSNVKIFKEKDYDDKSYQNYRRFTYNSDSVKYAIIDKVESLDDGTSAEEALLKAHYDESWTDHLNYSYTVTWEGVPPVEVGDYVECVLDSTFYINGKKSILSGVKQVKSLSYECSNDDACNIRTTIGLDKVSPVIELYKNFRKVKKAVAGKTTKYTSTAIYNPSTPTTFKSD